MVATNLSNSEIVQRAKIIYDGQIRDQVSPQRKGEYLVLDIESGDYATDKDDVTAELELRRRHPNGVFFGFRIGFKTAYAMGAALQEADN